MPGQLRNDLIPYLRRVTGGTESGACDDADLLRRFAAERDQAAFATLVRRHGPMVFGVCQRLLRHSHDAEDAFQATFLVLARRAGAVGRPELLGNWLYGVATRTALEARNRRARRQLLEQRAMHAMQDGPQSQHDGETWAEARQALDEEIHLLPTRYRQPFVCCYLEGKTNDEAARLLGCPPGTIYSRLAWARDRLRERLQRRGLAIPAVALPALLTEQLASAAVPPACLAATLQVAQGVAAGGAATASVSAEIASLSQGVINAMLWKSACYYVAAAAVACTLTLGGTLALTAAGEPTSARYTAQAGQQPGKAKTDAERIVGTWKWVEGQRGGEMLPMELVGLMRFTFAKDGTLTVSVLDDKKSSKYSLPAAGQVDMQQNGANDLSKGIYKFEGEDRLIICTQDAPAGPRPTEFASGKSQLLLVLVRTKPGDEKISDEQAEAIKKVKEAAARAQSTNYLKQIGLAMHVYYDAHQVFPAHAIYSKDGKTPLLSWRVAILPYIEQLQLYNQFKLDEPWDSEHNKKLIPKMPQIYGPLQGGNAEAGLTYYQVFTGPDTPFPGAKQLKIGDFTDGLSNTLLVVEGKDMVVWTKPADLALPKEKDRLTPIGGQFAKGTLGCFADGSVRFFDRSLTGPQLRSMVTPAAGD